MIVMKFGGTSVGSPERIKEVANILVNFGQPLLVVLSAMSGTTNALVEIANCYRKGDNGQAGTLIAELQQKYQQHVQSLYATEEMRQKTAALLEDKFNFIRSFAGDYFSSFEEKQIVAQGEIMSTNMMVNYLIECGYAACLLNALNMVYTNKDGEPDMEKISQATHAALSANANKQIYVTQGFISTNAFGETDNLQRGGSDYTATLLGAAIRSEEVQIWTDVDGIHTADPRIVSDTRAIREVSFNEAAELARFGAKILHPTCVIPAQKADVPIRLKYTMDPEAEGTLITNSPSTSSSSAAATPTAIASKEPITLLRLQPKHNISATTLLKRVCDELIAHQLQPDLTALCGGNILMAIGNDAMTEDFIERVQLWSYLNKDMNCSLIAIVGDYEDNEKLRGCVMDAVPQQAIKVHLQGISPLSISFVVKRDNRDAFISSMHQQLFAL